MLVALAAGLSGVSAQVTGRRVYRIGFLSFGERPPGGALPWNRRHLEALGWFEGRNVEFVSHYTGDSSDLLDRQAAALVASGLDIIVTSGTDAALAAQRATRRIPIVLLAAGDPVASGLAASLARPGGNITGFSVLSTELRAKRIDLLRELLPNARRVGEFVNPRNPLWKVKRKNYEDNYRSRGLQPLFIDVATAEAVPDAFARLSEQRIQVLMVNDDNLYSGALAARMMELALERRIPTVVGDGALAQDGALVSYAPGGGEASEKFAYFVDRILKGAAPADLPIEQASRFRLVINLRTAKALDVLVPGAMLLRADQVIQ